MQAFTKAGGHPELATQKAYSVCRPKARVGFRPYHSWAAAKEGGKIDPNQTDPVLGISSLSFLSSS